MNVDQRELALLADTQPITLASPEELKRCTTYREALQRQVRTSRNPYADYELAEKVGVDAGTFARIVGKASMTPKQRRHLPGEARAPLFAHTGNAFLSQWELFQVGLAVTPIDEVRAENARLKERLAAIEAKLEATA